MIGGPHRQLYYANAGDNERDLPADVGHACKSIAGMDIEDIFHGEGRTNEVSSVGVYHAFWLASRPRSLFHRVPRQQRSPWGKRVEKY